METPSISSIEVLHGIGGSLLSLLRIGAGPMNQIATGFEKAPPTNIEHLLKFAGTTGLTKLCSASHLLSCSSRWWWVGVKQTALKKKILAQTLLGILPLFLLTETAFSRAAAQTLGRPAAWWPVRSLFLAKLPTELVKSGNCRQVKVMVKFVRNLKIDQIWPNGFQFHIPKWIELRFNHIENELHLFGCVKILDISTYHHSSESFQVILSLCMWRSNSATWCSHQPLGWNRTSPRCPWNRTTQSRYGG